MTNIKFGLVGLAYMILLSIGPGLAVILGFLTL